MQDKPLVATSFGMWNGVQNPDKSVGFSFDKSVVSDDPTSK